MCQLRQMWRIKSIKRNVENRQEGEWFRTSQRWGEGSLPSSFYFRALPITRMPAEVPALGHRPPWPRRLRQPPARCSSPGLPEAPWRGSRWEGQVQTAVASCLLWSGEERAT